MVVILTVHYESDDTSVDWKVFSVADQSDPLYIYFLTYLL